MGGIDKEAILSKRVESLLHSGVTGASDPWVIVDWTVTRELRIKGKLSEVAAKLGRGGDQERLDA